MFSFDLSSIIIDTQPPGGSTLGLTGSGILHGTGFDDTVFDWSLAATSVGGDLTFFIAPQEPHIYVTEPSTISSMLVLLGLSIMGICAWDRRRRPRTTTR